MTTNAARARNLCMKTDSGLDTETTKNNTEQNFMETTASLRLVVFVHDQISVFSCIEAIKKKAEAQ